MTDAGRKTGLGEEMVSRRKTRKARPLGEYVAVGAWGCGLGHWRTHEREESPVAFREPVHLGERIGPFAAPVGDETGPKVGRRSAEVLEGEAEHKKPSTGVRSAYSGSQQVQP